MNWNVLRTQMWWDLVYDEISNVMRPQRWWYLKYDVTSNVMRPQMWWDLKYNETTNIMRPQMWWGLKYVEFSYVMRFKMWWFIIYIKLFNGCFHFNKMRIFYIKINDDKKFRWKFKFLVEFCFFNFKSWSNKSMLKLFIFSI